MTNNQIILSTHSPVFISPDTVRNVVRVYGERGASRNTSEVRRTELETQKLLEMLNSHNNERLFFADAVVLVEGLKDRIIFQIMIESRTEFMRPIKIIEVVEVLGSGNLLAYSQLASSVRVPSCTVADFDYLTVVGGQSVAERLKLDNKKLARIVLDKKSIDRRSLVDAMDSAIVSGSKDELIDVWNYVKKRSVKLPEDLSKADMLVMSEAIRRLSDTGVFILSKGEIEDYLLPEKRALNH